MELVRICIKDISEAGVELFISLCHLNVDQNKVGRKQGSRKQLDSQEIQQTNCSLLPALKDKNVTDGQHSSGVEIYDY